MALNVIGIALAWLGEQSESERYLRQCLALAESIGSSIGIDYAVVNLILYHYGLGEYEKWLATAVEQMEKALVRNDEWLVAWMQFWEGLALCCVGQYEAAQEMLQVSSDTMARIGSPGDRSWLLVHAGLFQTLAGDYEQAFENLQHAAQTASKAQDAGNHGRALIFQGLCALHEGRRETMEWATEPVQQSLEVLHEEMLTLKSLSYGIMAALRLALGEVGEALDSSLQSLQIMATAPSIWWPEWMFFIHAQILRALGREKEADEYLQRAYDRVMLVAGKTRDAKLRQSWLENVKMNRDILAAAAEHGIGD
jgi:tetratricopeptide (TPR) repeat protein